MSLKAVFFDLDGTLLDTAPDFVVTMNQLADEYQVPRLTAEQVRQKVSDGAKALTTALFQLQEGEDGFQERRQRLLDIYHEYMGKHCVLFDGMFELVQQIVANQLAWGIITNKPVRFAQPIVDDLGLHHPPALLICPDHVSQTKPHAEPLLQACKRVDCQPHEAVYLGDHLRDIECGINAGSPTIAVSFGYIHDDDNIHAWRADHVVDHANEIWPILNNYL